MARRITRVAVAAALLSAIVAAAALAASGGAVVKLGKTGLGRVLVDASGRTLYMFEPDRYGRSVCYGKCAQFWPPLLATGAPRGAGGVRSALLGTTKRRDGKLQVTYAGYPLYLFVKDTRAGQTAGQGIDGFGGGWYVLDAQGRTIEDGRHGGPAEVATARTPLGRVLVDGRGRMLYLFEADTGTTSTCYGRCAVFWPPLLTTGKPEAASGARIALLGTTKRRDGTLQVTYAGHPLYSFLKDRQAGQMLGQAVDASGGLWYVLDPAGAAVTRAQAAAKPSGVSSSGASSGAGGGYGG